MTLSAKLNALTQQAALQNQAATNAPQIAVLVLAADRQTILEAELRPLSDVTAALAAHQSPITSA